MLSSFRSSSENVIAHAQQKRVPGGGGRERVFRRKHTSSVSKQSSSSCLFFSKYTVYEHHKHNNKKISYHRWTKRSKRKKSHFSPYVSTVCHFAVEKVHLLKYWAKANLRYSNLHCSNFILLLLYNSDRNIALFIPLYL